MNNIVVDDLVKVYQGRTWEITALDHVSVAFQSSVATAIVGPSGSGKSTLIKAIGCLLEPDQGTIHYDEETPDFSSDHRLTVFRRNLFGYILQNYALIPDETVYRNIALPLCNNKSLSTKQKKKRIYSAAKKVGIFELLKKRADELSGGQQQRTAIARAIVMDQPILLADEPTGSLDYENKINIIHILLDECHRKNKILIIVTHDPEIAGMCDRILMMKDGRLTEATFEKIGFMTNSVAAL